MSDFTDGIGGMVEGGAIGRAVEREINAGDSASTQKGGRGHFHETACLNCETELVGSQCHNCGQEAHLHRTIGAFLHDLMHGVLHLDGKIWRTLPMLAVKPGHLTREYIDGKRRRHVSPMALFLFSVFAMFAVFSMVGLSVPTDLRGGGVDGDVPAAIEQTEGQLEAALARLETQTEGSPAYEETQAEIGKLVAARSSLGGFGAKDSEGKTSGGTGVPELDKGLKKWRENPSLMIYKLQSSGYKFSWLLIPLSLPFMWLMFFWKQKYGLYDHSVFVTYSIAFMSLLFIAASLLAIVRGPPSWVIATLCTVVPVVHIYKQLRYGYSLSRVGALVRTAAALVFISVVLMLFLTILLLLGILG
jgi:hypothetical protein